jgi:predicted nucleotidyltransferase component of viral defense system
MYNILVEICREAFLASSLGFKGGTACFFFYGLPRFSVDLDFDILIKEVTDGELKQIASRLADIFQRQNLKIKDHWIKRKTLFFLLSHQSGSQSLKIEISRRDYPNTYEIKDFYGLSLRVMSRADMFAHKLIAATERKNIAMRDFFDLHFFFKEGWPINEEIVKLRTGKSLKEYLILLKDFAGEKITARNALSGLGELVDEKQKVWIKNSLKKELIGIIDFYLAKIIS